jgi:hypothetical protein
LCKVYFIFSLGFRSAVRSKCSIFSLRFTRLCNSIDSISLEQTPEQEFHLNWFTDICQQHLQKKRSPISTKALVKSQQNNPSSDQMIIWIGGAMERRNNRIYTTLIEIIDGDEEL